MKRFLRSPSLPSLLLLAGFLIWTKASAQIKIYENGTATRIGSDLGYNADSPTRTKIDLAGAWQYSLDGETWNTVLIPASFDYEGKVILLKKVSVTEEQLKKFSFSLTALGINNDAEVYVNDVFIGKHIGGFTSFDLEIPPNVLQVGSENALKIIVTNHLAASSTLPVRKQIFGWRNFGGIVRDIYLLGKPYEWIDAVDATTTLGVAPQQSTVDIKVTVSAISPNGTAIDTMQGGARTVQRYLEVDLLDRSSGAVVARSQQMPLQVSMNRSMEQSVTFTVANPVHWSPDNPEFYILRTVLMAGEGKTRTVVDETSQSVGFRRIGFENGRLMLNGEPVEVKGVVWVEDSKDYGASLTYTEMEREVGLIKMLGANAVRFAFHAPHPYMVELCTRFGLMAMEEVPAYCVPPAVLAEDPFQSLAENMLVEMIERDHHQPSVIAWGLGSDLDTGDPRTKAYLERLAARTKAMKGGMTYYGTRTLETDCCASVVDIPGINMPEADAKQFKNILTAWKKKLGGAPVLVMQYGKKVEPGNRGGYSDPMSYEAQGKQLLASFGAIREVQAAGGFVNAFADWRGDRPIFSVKQADPYLHPVGLVGYDRERRPAFEVIKALYKGERPSALSIGQYKASFPIIHIVTGLIIIFVFAYLYNYNRRFSETFKRTLMHPYNFFADLRDIRVASSVQTMVLGALMSVTLALLLSSILFHYRRDPFADFVITQFVVWDGLKAQLIHATWYPLEGVLMFSAFFFLLSIVAAALILLGGMLVGAHVRLFHAYTVAVWAALPVIFLSFIGMVLFKVMETQAYVVPSFAVIGLILVWTAYRLLEGVTVLYDVRGFRVVLGSIVLAAAVLGGIYWYYSYYFAIGGYVEYLIHTAGGVL